MNGMKIICSVVIMLSAIGTMLSAVEATSHPEYGSLTVAAAIVFCAGFIGRCVLEVPQRVRDDV